jgi:multiple sugar transport system permease protein
LRKAVSKVISRTLQELKRSRAGVGAGGRGGYLARPAPIRGALITPSIVLLVLLNAYPVIYAVMQSLHKGSLITTGPYVGFDNYAKAFGDPNFWAAVRFTLIFTLAGVFGSWACGLGLALLLQKKTPMRAVFKVLLLVPWIVPIVVSTASWQWLLGTPSSPIPLLFQALGLGQPLFLANPGLAALTVCLFKVWVSIPFMMLMSSAALTAVNSAVYEAAKLDGASRWQMFTQITAPLIARPTYVSWVLMTIFCVNDFPTIYLLTGGGPVDSTTSLIVMAYRTAFQDFQVGYGAAIALLMTAALVIVSVALFRQIRKSAVH